MLKLLNRYPLPFFILFSYAITWPAWLLEARGVTWAAFPGYFGPAIAAFIMLAVTQGKSGLEELFARLFRWRVPLRWYLIALFLPLFSILIVVGFQIVTGRAGPIPGETLAARLPQLVMMGIGLSLYGTLVAAGEEIGWRGYALPKLLQGYRPLVASILVGIIWGLWHLPLRWLYASDSNLVDALFYGLGIDAAAVIYTWLYLNTRGSLLIASLFHAVYDVTVILAGSLLGALFSFRVHMVVLIIIAIILAVGTGMRKRKTIV